MEQLTPYPETLDETLAPIAARLAVEGVPVAAIARSLLQPSDLVRETLAEALADGRITEIPRSDWPPTARRTDRLPTSMAREDDGAMQVSCMRAFAITKLMAGFMLVLLKRDEADKNTLHRIIEAQRVERRVRPNDMDETDPKMVDVIICKLRQRLKPHGISIDTIWGHGYFMSTESRRKAHDMIAALSPAKGAPEGVQNDQSSYE